MPEKPITGRTVTARRYGRCFECGEETIQTLRYIHTTSPGSYRGTRLRRTYTCGQCGGMCHG